MRLSLVLAASLLLAPAAHAGDATLGDLTISGAVARETPKGAKAGAGFFSLRNDGATADRLIAVEADFPLIEIHETKMSDGIARMQEIGTIELAPGAEVTLMPGGKHVMFMGLSRPLGVGDQIPATLVFEKAGRVEITFEVRPRSELMPKHDMNSHSSTGN